jgi:hypothetical protein
VSTPPNWWLIKEIIRQVRTTPGSGIHRADLAAIVSLPAHGPAIRNALMIAYKLRKIDFVGQYVVLPSAQRGPGQNGQKSTNRAHSPEHRALIYPPGAWHHVT